MGGVDRRARERCDGCGERGGKVGARLLEIGILPDGKAQVSRYVDVAIVTDLGQARNNVNVMSSDIIVACGSAVPERSQKLRWH